MRLPAASLRSMRHEIASTTCDRAGESVEQENH